MVIKKFKQPYMLLWILFFFIFILPASANEPGSVDLKKIFKYYHSPHIIADIPHGKISDFALDDKHVYLLVQKFNGITDAIVKVDRQSNRIRTIWGIGKFQSKAIETFGKQLWVIGKMKNHFIRIFTVSGKWRRTLKLKTELPGEIHGLGIKKGRVYFAHHNNEKSELCVYNTATGKHKAFYTFEEKIYSIVFKDETLYAYQNSFDVYSDHWLIAITFNPLKYKKYHFLNEKVVSLGADKNNVYCLIKNDIRMNIFPFAVMEKENIILGKPVYRKIQITYPVQNRLSKGKTSKIWIPCPGSGMGQNIENLTIIPKPVEYIKDEFNNKWASIVWNFGIKEKAITVKYKALTADVAYTLNKYNSNTTQNIPGKIKSRYTVSTKCIDFDNPSVNDIMPVFNVSKTYLNRILTVRDYIVNSFYVGDVNLYLDKASSYLQLRRGLDYGHALSFAALARKEGIPARIVSAVYLSNENKKFNSKSYIWNQVYIPPIGWVDIDIYKDNRNYQKSLSQYIGYRSNQSIVYFSGSLDNADFKKVFAQKNIDYSVKDAENISIGKIETAFSTIKPKIKKKQRKRRRIRRRYKRRTVRAKRSRKSRATKRRKK